MNGNIKILDCTLRDGGYYNAWDFTESLIQLYLKAIEAAGIDTVELGFRSLENNGFKGACTYTTDSFLRSLNLSDELTIGVMVNASELVNSAILEEVLTHLFPAPAKESPVDLVRIACHVHEFEPALVAASWLKKRGYLVGFNLMQVASHSESDIKILAKLAAQHPIDVLYFADSMGNMMPDDTIKIIQWLRSEWKGAIGIHTHDNLGLALSNALCALNEGVTWVDSTVTGMGRGPGNARTEELVVEVAERCNRTLNLMPLVKLLQQNFKPMQASYGWGTNIYYYLSGKYGIHPTYIQEMLNDSRYDEEDVLSVIQHLRQEGGQKFNWSTLDVARNFYHGSPIGNWSPLSQLEDREILLLGTGPGVKRHSAALERFIDSNKPLVVALNTQSAIKVELIDMRVACHPVRLRADCDAHTKLPQPLITPYSMLPDDVKFALADKEVLDFGLNIQVDTFAFEDTHCTIPTSLVVAYALAVITSGKAKRVLMAGFDGYIGEDPRNYETNKLFKQFQEADDSVEIKCITPTRYDIPTESIYGELS
jgi:4-hydroxy 2-oxovalerate aldolase